MVSLESEKGVADQSPERWRCDLPHMREMRDTLERETEKKYGGKDGFRRLESADPEAQREIVGKALRDARAWYKGLEYYDKVSLVGQIEEAYTQGSLTLSDLLQGLGLKPEESRDRDGGILGKLRQVFSKPKNS